MPFFVHKNRTTFSVTAKFTVTAVVVVLLFFGSNMMTADEKTNSLAKPVAHTEKGHEHDHGQKPGFFSSDGKFLSSLRFWDKDKKKSSSASPAARQQQPPPNVQNGSAKRTAGTNSQTEENNFAPVPPPNPYFDSETGQAAPHPELPSTIEQPAASSYQMPAPQGNASIATSYVSYSYDTRDWIESFSPQYEEEVLKMETVQAETVKPESIKTETVKTNLVKTEAAAEHQKTAHRTPATAAALTVTSTVPPEQEGWNGHATKFVLPSSPESVKQESVSQVSATAPSARTAAAKPPIDLSPSYKKRLPYVQTFGVVVVQANFPLTEIPLILDEINLLQHDLTRYIGVPEPKEKIELCLFTEGESYTRFLQEYFPRAPLDRRALYVKLDHKPGTLMVQKSKDFEIDLRHEMTHAIIHASIPEVPIWLDEGLAKYFEVPAKDRLSHNPYMSQTRWNLKLGMVPSLERLVQLETIDDMGSKEYRDSWAWTHFLIHRSPDTHRLLAAYLQMLAERSSRSEEKPEPASKFSAAGQKVKTIFVKEFLGRGTAGAMPSLKPYLAERVSNPREAFKAHFGAVEQ